MNILVTGGQGYIGSHACKLLRQSGHNVVSLDNLSRGHANISQWALTVQASTHDRSVVKEVLQKHGIHAVMHFAAFAYVGESEIQPHEYYWNNVTGTQCLLEAMRETGVTTMIFSSTCATYGNPIGGKPIDETLEQRPVSVYGRSKFFCEQVIRDYCKAYGFSAICFRYFNAAGADPEGDLGEDHDPEPHLIPLAIRTALNSGLRFKVNGQDFPTPDGTAIRDFVHVVDIVKAHELGLTFALAHRGEFHAFNLSNSKGYSVLEVLKTVENVAKTRIAIDIGPRRPGDAEFLVGNSDKVKSQLSWKPTYETLMPMVETAWNWERKKRIA